MAKAASVLWHLTDADDDEGRGYRIDVCNANGSIIHSYSAGDHPQSSADYANEGEGLAESTLRDFAVQTARELAEEYGVDPAFVREE